MMTPFHELRARDRREAERLAEEARAERLDRIFSQLEARRNPQVGDGPDELPLWELTKANR